jgi:hypothetical protein
MEEEDAAISLRMTGGYHSSDGGKHCPVWRESVAERILRHILRDGRDGRTAPEQ